MSGRKGQRYRTVTLTKRGLIAAICAQAAPYVVPACEVCGGHVHSFRVCSGLGGGR